MDNSKILMFPEYGYGNNNNNGILGGWGGGILGFILGILLGNGGFFGNGGFGNNGNGAAGFLSNQIDNANGRDLIMNAINGTDADVRMLATTLNADINEVNGAINSVRDAIQQVSAQTGMGFLQVTNAIQNGNASLSRQLCECCCENRLLTTQQGYESQIRTLEQTNQLSSQADRNTNSIVSSIADLKSSMIDQFCNVEKREMQNKIDTLTADNALLRSNANNAMQTAFINEKFNAVQNELTSIKAAQPNTVPVQWPQLTAVNTTPYFAGGFYGFNNGWGSNSFWN